MVRFTRNQVLIVVIDGLLGAAIGGVSVGYETAFGPLARHRLAMFMVGASVTGMLFAIPMFTATVALAPALLAVLGRWRQRSAVRYYLKSALAGVVFGVVACAAVGFVSGLLVPFLPSSGSSIPERLWVLAGAPFLLATGFFFSGFLFWRELLIAGVGFGVFNGWWVRRHSRYPRAEQGR